MQFIFEAHFTGSESHFWDHYGRKILFNGDKFDYRDPKFPYMTTDDYDNYADELSTHPADEIDSNSEYVGGKLIKDNRLIKIRKHSKFVPKKYGDYMDVVIYKDPPDEQVFTFMPVKRERLDSKYKFQIVDSLPENK